LTDRDVGRREQDVDAGGERTSKNKRFVQRVADQNAKDAAGLLTSRSDVMASLVNESKFKIVSAMHDVATGNVRWLSRSVVN
jgi:carbonic anhydrase